MTYGNDFQTRGLTYFVLKSAMKLCWGTLEVRPEVSCAVTTCSIFRKMANCLTGCPSVGVDRCLFPACCDSVADFSKGTLVSLFSSPSLLSISFPHTIVSFLGHSFTPALN